MTDALGVTKLHVVETGGDAYQQAREQWDDGNNVVALEPGVVVAYERNTFTISKMREAGRRGRHDRGLRAGQGPGRRALHDLPGRPRPDLREDAGMDGPVRWVVAILVVAAIIALVAFARGDPEHGEPTAPPAAIQVVGASV